MAENRAILAPIDREIVRSARRTWVKELMFRDPMQGELDVDLNFSFFVTEPAKASSFETICDGQRRLRAYKSGDVFSPNPDLCASILNSKESQSVSEFTFLTYKSASAVKLAVGAAIQTLFTSFEDGGLVEQYKEKFDLGNQRKFWSFFDGLRDANKSALGLLHELPSKNLILGLGNTKHRRDIEYQLHISVDDMQLLWDEVAQDGFNFHSSSYDLEGILRSAFEQRIWKVARVRARVQFCSPINKRSSPNNIREQIFGFVIHTGNSPPCSGAQVCTLVRSQLEKSYVTIWKFSYPKNIPWALRKRRARRRDNACSSPTRCSRSSYVPRRNSFRRPRTYREVATLQAASLSCARIRQVVDKL
jgi:hypothetical protein